MSGSILPTTKRKTSRCLVQGQKQCGKILKGKFTVNLQNKHKNEFQECDTTKPRELTVPEQKERARHLHKKQ